MNESTWKSALRTGGSLIYKFILKMFEISMFRSDKQSDSPVNEILFYGAEDEERSKQKGLNNMLCICYIILHATKTVDVCLPSLSNYTLARCLVKVHQKNDVKMRIAIHNSKNFHNLLLFTQTGIEVKIITPRVMLEHEFVVVDAGTREAVAALGALDDDLCLRRDATLLSSDPAVLTPLAREFERVWNAKSESLTLAKFINKALEDESD